MRCCTVFTVGCICVYILVQRSDRSVVSQLLTGAGQKDWVRSRWRCVEHFQPMSFSTFGRHSVAERARALGICGRRRPVLPASVALPVNPREVTIV